MRGQVKYLWSAVSTCPHLHNAVVDYAEITDALRSGLPKCLVVGQIAACDGEDIWRETLAKISLALRMYFSKIKYSELRYRSLFQ